MDVTRYIDPQTKETCAERKISAIKSAINEGFLSEENNLVLFYDFQFYRNTIDEVKSAFPSHWIHTMAIKSNPIKKIMEFAHENGLGFEAASLGELEQALRVSPASKVVFDSPTKTRKELLYSLEKGVYLNLDNLQELERVEQMFKEKSFNSPQVGLRINPQVGLGVIKDMSTAGEISKFGIAFKENQDAVYEAYKRNSFLNGIHIHVGSQGCPLDLILLGISKIIEIVREINTRAGFQQIKFIDIGGGLPVNFNDEREHTPESPSFGEYAALLKKVGPELFSGEYTVLTEFGRRFNAKQGFIVTRVEYTKESGGRKFASVHVGTDLFLRTVWAPTKWAVRVSALDSEGNLKTDKERIPYDVAGPCCFSGDVIAHERQLPPLQPGDYVIAHDTGAYYYGSYCYYNVRQAPPIYVFDSDPTKLTLLKRAHTVQDTLSFFE